MNTSITQKRYLRAALQIIAVLVAIPQVVRAEEAADLSRFNVQSCVSDEMREATAQKYLKAIDVPQYSREFLSNLKYALEHDWLLQEDFYTVNYIRHLLGVSEVYVSCLEHKHFLPSFSAYGAVYRARTAEKPSLLLTDPDSSDGFYNKSGGSAAGGLKHLEDGRLQGVFSLDVIEQLPIDFVETTLGRPLSRQEFLASSLAKEFINLAPPRPWERYFDFSDDRVWRYFVVYYVGPVQHFLIMTRQRKQL